MKKRTQIMTPSLAALCRCYNGYGNTGTGK